MQASSLLHSEPVELPQDAVEVGRVIGAWGVKGWIKVQPYASDPQALFSSTRWYAGASKSPSQFNQPEKNENSQQRWKVKHSKAHGDFIVAQIEGIDDRTSAEACRGVTICVPRSSFPSTQKDEFYWVDLIGSLVKNRQGVELGLVKDLMDTGPHSILRVVSVAASASGDFSEYLIPFVDAYIDQVDLSNRSIFVDWETDY